MTLREENEEWTQLAREDSGKSFEPLKSSVDQKIRHKNRLNKEQSHDDTCIFCDKTIQQAGGKQIASSYFIKMFISDKFYGGGDPDYPYQSVKIDGGRYLVFKGKLSVWTKTNIEKAVSLVKEGKTIWFCQFCGNRTCSLCGSPSQYLHGVDLLNGGHCAVLPVPSGCDNLKCEKHIIGF